MRSFKLADAINKLPEELEDLLVRGAYLEHSAQHLERHHHEKAAQLETVKATQPPFMFLQSRETRVAFKTAARSTNEDLTAINQALVMNKRLCDHLRARSEELLEKWLRAHCEEYRIGLAAGHFADDWDRSLAIFVDHANSFIQALGAARNIAPAGYDRARGVFSQATYQAISTAHASALKVEADIVATNAIAAEHDKMLGKTIFNDPMPRLVHEPYAAVVAQIATMPPVAAQAEFMRVIMAVEDLITRELGAIRERVRNSAHDHEGRTHSYVRDAWNQLHAHAVAYCVDTRQIDSVVAQTERAFAPKLAAEPAMA